MLGIGIYDLKHHGWNNLMGLSHFFAGCLTAYFVRDIVGKILKSQSQRREHLMTGCAVAVGIGVSAYLISYTPHIRLNEEMNLKFFAFQAVIAFAIAWFSKNIKCLALVFLGGTGFFENRMILVVFGAAGALQGVLASLPTLERK